MGDTAYLNGKILSQTAARANMDEAERWLARFGKGLNDSSPDKMWNVKYADYFEQKRSSKILDLGCGDGVHACYMHDKRYNVTACDISSTALKVVNERNPAVPTLLFDMAQGLPFPGESFGIVFSSLSVHYFTMSDTITLFENIHTVLEMGGYFIFKVNSYKEYYLTTKGKNTTRIEEDYFLSPNGEKRRYFTVDSMEKLLARFSVLSLAENDFTYHGKTKYSIEGVAQKI
ncbi:MAG: class I SAM-dependent methyltransferase [Desulfovibrio sp.]|nr:class I SAM-dependent methyltransferase [Desulfovibrio sp.]